MNTNTVPLNEDPNAVNIKVPILGAATSEGNTIKADIKPTPKAVITFLKVFGSLSITSVRRAARLPTKHITTIMIKKAYKGKRRYKKGYRTFNCSIKLNEPPTVEVPATANVDNILAVINS